MSVFLTLGYIVNGSFRLPPQSQGQSLVLTFTTVSLSQTDFFFWLQRPPCACPHFSATPQRRDVGLDRRSDFLTLLKWLRLGLRTLN